MDKLTLIDRLEEVVRSLREQLNKNENSTMDNMGNAARMSFESLKATLSGNDAVKFALDKFKDHEEVFNTALKNQDRAMAVRALDAMESTINNLRTLDM